MNAAPSTIGYWARHHGLQWEDVIKDDELREALDAADEKSFGDEVHRCGGNLEAAHSRYKTAKASFRDGWSECDDEIRAEKLANLKSYLSDLSC